ncbi:LPXTG cell wall anchor domain-containing protein [Streptococcus salivarius]
MLNKQIYGFKKSKAFGLCSVVVASYLLFSGVASADELAGNQEGSNQPVVTETSNDQVVQTPTAADVSKAQGELNQANNELTDAQSNVEEKQQALNVATVEKDKRVEEVNQAQELADKATPSEVQKAQTAVENKQNVVVEAEKTLENAKQVNQKAQEAVLAQQTNVDDAKKQVAKEETNVANAQNKVKVAESAFDAKTLLKAQQDVAKLEEKVQADQEKTNAMAIEIAKAQKEQNELLENGNKTRSNLETNLKNAGDEYLTEIITHELARNEVPEYETKTSAFTENTFIGRDGGTYYSYANEDVDFDGEKTETIVLKSEEDYKTPHIVDYKKVSEEVRNYLIELRKINGIDIPVPEVTDKALKYAKARADEMLANSELSHRTKLKHADFGLIRSTENATQSLPEMSELSEKEIAYNDLLSYFNDYRNASRYGTDDPNEVNVYNYGHRTTLLAASGTGVAVNASSSKDSIYENYGVLEFVSDKKDVKVYPRVGYFSTTHDLATAENKDADPTHTEYYFNGKRVKFLPKTTFVYVWKETTHPKNPVYAKAKEALDTFNTKQAKDEATLVQKLSTLNNDFSSLQAVLLKDKQDLDVANKRLDALTKENEAKILVLKAAQNELANRENDLKAAQTALLKQEGELALRKTVKNNAEKLVSEASKLLTDAHHELTDAKKHVELLQSAPKKLEEAKARLTNAEKNYNEAEKALKSALKELSLAKEKQANLQANFEKVSKAYNDYIKAKEESERQERLKKEYEALTRKTAQKASVSNASTKVTAYKSSEAYSMLDIKHNIGEKTSYRSEGIVEGSKNSTLPATGETSAVNGTTVFALMMTMLGLVGFKRKEDKY